ncbi:helix-turn-helix domain-containing protein [Celerinatantimonas sp. MCCC 1A17872]|uniref:AraC family transcriptional regulator n=1 Tax=Celerinatantimonas sp. MCCC 1A17872 TaxID=3177514 RepID=UPI0038C5DA19
MDKVHYQSTDEKGIGLIHGSYQQFAFERHYHLDYHIGLITAGEQRFLYRGEHHRIGPEELVIMQPDELHDGYAPHSYGYQVRVFSITPQWFDSHLNLAKPTILSFKQLIIKDRALFYRLIQAHLLMHDKTLSQLAKDCIPYEALSMLVEHYATIKERQAVQLGQQTLATLREFMLAHLDQPIHLHQLSNICQLSPVQFQRHFKAAMGITPYAWLLRLRLEQAMGLIKAKIPGTDVAQQVGFYDQAHFSKAFKRAYGVTPSQVR